MTENEFLLSDRITKIKSINDMYDLEHNAYISFSGGKDSTVLSALIDMALPNNEIPRVFINTGIEYKDIVQYVRESSAIDNRIKIVNSGINIKSMLAEKGYPFKSKIFAHNLAIAQRTGLTQNVQNFLNDKKHGCPSNLQYMFHSKLDFKVSENCCNELKKKPSHKWAVENQKTINITGIRSEEGGGRKIHKNCTVFNSDNSLKKFHPLLVITEDFEEWFIKTYGIELCKLYYPPFNFKRTGCKGCPFALKLQEQLDSMEELLPTEKKQCEYLWKPIYDEYRRIGYRLRPKGLFD